MNYPTEEYESYAECDDHFVRRSLPSDLQPFWAVDNISEAGNTISLDPDTWEHMDFGKTIIFTRKAKRLFLDGLYNGIVVSNCLLPCLRTEATVEEGTKTNYENSMFSLTFNEKVRVKKTSVDQFSFMGSLNFFGSNLGLWPGLGLYQILELAVGILIASQVLRKITKRCNR